MYLIDTHAVSEARKGPEADPGVARFLEETVTDGVAHYLSAVSVGELRRGVDLIRHRGEAAQAALLEVWLDSILVEFSARVLTFDADAAQVWGHLRVPHPEHALDKQIAAIALVNDLTVVTRNVADFAGTGVRLRNPFVPVAGEKQ